MLDIAPGNVWSVVSFSFALDASALVCAADVIAIQYPDASALFTGR